MATLKPLPAHPIAEAFPPANAEDRGRIKDSLVKNGQLENIVTLDGMVLDGLNRQSILIELEVPPRYVDWTTLGEELTKNGPVEYVKARNLDRRHLDKGQRAAVAANLVPFFEKEALERRDARNAQLKTPVPPIGGSGPADEFSQETAHRPEDDSQDARRRRTAESTAKAAAAVGGVSQRSVQRAVSLKKKDPEKFEKVRAGGMSLNKATRDVSKEAAAKKEVEDALKRIEKIGGEVLAEAMKKRKRPEILTLAGMSDADLKKVRGLVSVGWTVKKASDYKMTALSRTHSIGDLCIRALAHGVAKSGSFELEITHEDVPLIITVRKAKAD